MTSHIDERNRVAWADHYRRSGPLLYPDERVVVFLASQFGDRGANRHRTALDIGFGTGRHLALLADYEFEVYGVDFNPEVVEAAQRSFAGNERIKQLVAVHLDQAPFPDAFFDVIVALGVMFLRPIDEMIRDFRVLNRLLKPGGKMVVNFRTKENWFFGKGQAVSGETFLLDETAGPYRGMYYTFLDSDRSQAVLEETGFGVINRERMDLWKENATKRHSWDIFWVQKERDTQ